MQRKIENRAISLALSLLRALAVGGICLLAAGCDTGAERGGSRRDRNAFAIDLQRFVFLPRPPVVQAKDEEGIRTARQIMHNLATEDVGQRAGAQFRTANALPWLTGSNEGRAFLAGQGARVLVRGHPATFCPAALSEAGDEGVEALTERALKRCLAQVGPGCACQVIAAGSVLLVPPEELKYATGIAARVRAPSLGIDGMLVAEELAGGAVLLRDLSRAVGVMQRGEGDRVTVRIGPGPAVFAGRSRKVGFRRGRLAERIYATDGDGHRLVLLIGFDPNELARLAGAWLAWPKGP